MWHVHTVAIRALSGGVYTAEEIQAWIEDDVPETYRRDISLGKTVLVAEHEGRIIGFSCLSANEVEALYVHPLHAHHNVGQVLLTAIEHVGLIHHARSLSLDAAMNAVDFYRTCGYQVLGYSTPTFDSGRALPCVRMRKTLETPKPETGNRRDVPRKEFSAGRPTLAAVQT